MGSSDKFCLRWNDYESNISSSFRELRECSEFFDVTLCCDNGSDVVHAHKVILASCSPFFRRILSHNKHQNPFIYLKGIQQKELLLTLSFMYNGQVNVEQDELNSFLAVTEELAVKGLTSREVSENQENSEMNSEAPIERPSLPHSHRLGYSRRRQISPSQGFKRKPTTESAKVEPDEVMVKRIKEEEDNLTYHEAEGDDFNSLLPLQQTMSETEENIERFGGTFVEEGNEFEETPVGTPSTSNTQLGCESKGFERLEELESKVILVDNFYQCTLCEYRHKKRVQLLSHVESFHISNSYTCDICRHICPTLGAFKKHIYRNHRDRRPQTQSETRNANYM